MHELGLAEEIVAVACARAGEARVRRVVLEIGKLAAVVPEAIRFCFEVCSADTPAAGATLEIAWVDGLGRCRLCGGRVVLERPFGRCACGSSDVECTSGDELRIREMEVL